MAGHKWLDGVLKEAAADLIFILSRFPNPQRFQLFDLPSIIHGEPPGPGDDINAEHLSAREDFCLGKGCSRGS